jgi:hypothetical protein
MYYLRIRALFGAGSVFLNGQKAADFDGGELCADITALVREEGKNNVVLLLRPDTRAARGLLALYGDLDPPRILCTGVGGDVWIKGVSYARIASLEARWAGRGELAPGSRR